MIFRDLLNHLEATPNVSVLSSEDVLADDANTITVGDPSKFSVAPEIAVNPYNSEAMKVFLRSLPKEGQMVISLPSIEGGNQRGDLYLGTVRYELENYIGGAIVTVFPSAEIYHKTKSGEIHYVPNRTARNIKGDPYIEILSMLRAMPEYRKLARNAGH